MRAEAFSMPFGLLHHTEPSIELFSQNECDEINLYAGILESSCSIGEQEVDSNILTKLTKIGYVRDMFHEFYVGERNPLVMEHMRMALQRNETRSLMESIDYVTGDWENFRSKHAAWIESLLRTGSYDDVHFYCCLQTILGYTQELKTYALAIRQQHVRRGSELIDYIFGNQ